MAQFEDFQVGWLLIPNVKKPCHIRVKGVLAADDPDYPYQSRLVVAGDCRDLAEEGSRFRLITPIGAEQDTGEMQMDPWQRNTRRQWNGYDYQPPHLGHRDGMGNFQRRAPGPGDDVDVYDDNREGQYYCWNRTYDVRTARWTTPDPAAKPWSNLSGYVGNLVQQSDPSGLFGANIGGWGLLQEVARGTNRVHG